MRHGNIKAQRRRRKARDKLKPDYREKERARLLRQRRRRIHTEAGRLSSERQIREYYLRAKILAVLDELSREGYISQFNPMTAKVDTKSPLPNVTTIDIILA